jgi:hypothetical protein
VCICYRITFVCLFICMSATQRQHDTVQCSTVQYSAVQYSTVQYSTVQYSTVRARSVQYVTHSGRKEQHSMKWILSLELKSSWHFVSITNTRNHNKTQYQLIKMRLRVASHCFAFPCLDCSIYSSHLSLPPSPHTHTHLRTHTTYSLIHSHTHTHTDTHTHTHTHMHTTYSLKHTHTYTHTHTHILGKPLLDFI